MANKVGIGIQANLDTSGVEQQINQLGQKVAEANKVQYQPVSLKSADELSKVVKQFDQLLKVHGDLRKRVKDTGQQGKGFWDMDWGAMYPDQSARSRQTRKVMEYTLGSGVFHSPAPDPRDVQPESPGATSPQRRPEPSGAGAVVTKVAQAGLGALGPAGGVASQALGTGMSAGFGAGLMGLLGGMLALGVGKAVGAAMEKLGQAEDNAVALDRLKRVLGDVGVSFEALETVVKGGADNMRITYAEAERLGTQFAKIGNLSSDQYAQVGEEIETGVGMSRAFGLEPSQGVDVMGRMRGLGVTSSTQESRRFALLIGETIGKAGAFAKADEVMDAIASFASSQTRQNMSVANVADYAGAYSAMVSSGIPGMDPAGAAGLLARVNATLSQGGGKGEASQFFSAIVGQKMGLDPIQTQILREGGAFATNRSMFGDESVYRRYMGEEGPAGDKTFLQGSLDELRSQYGGNKKLLAQATANHLGLGINQAMALLSIKPHQMGEMQDRFGDLSKLSGSGIGNIAKALYGTEDERDALARGFEARSDVSVEDKQTIKAAEGDDGKLRGVLAELSARYGQERTMGSDIRDSKNALDNIKTQIASQLIPLTLEMRHGIMYMAGKDGTVSPEEIMRDVLKSESKGRVDAIEGRMDPEIDGLDRTYGALLGRRRVMKKGDQDTPAVDSEIGRVRGLIEKKVEEKHRLLDEENARLKASIEQMEKDLAKRRELEAQRQDEEAKLKRLIDEGAKPSSGDAPAPGAPARADAPNAGDRSYTSGDRGSNAGIGGDPGGRDAAMRFFVSKGWSREQSAGIVANLVAESNLRPGAVGDGGQAYGIAQWHPPRQDDFKRFAGKGIRESTFEEQLAFVHHEMTAGAERKAGDKLRGTATAAEAGAVVSRYYERPADIYGEARKRASMATEIASEPIKVSAVDRSAPAREVGRDPVVDVVVPGRASVEEPRAPMPAAPARGAENVPVADATIPDRASAPVPKTDATTREIGRDPVPAAEATTPDRASAPVPRAEATIREIGRDPVVEVVIPGQAAAPEARVPMPAALPRISEIGAPIAPFNPAASRATQPEPIPVLREVNIPVLSASRATLPADQRQNDRHPMTGPGPLNGEMAISLDLSSEARRLLQPPPAPVSGKFGRATPFGTYGGW